MKAIFQVKTIESEWAPPFRKTINKEQYEVTEKEKFDKIKGNGNNEAIFALAELKGDKAIVQYSPLFSLKMHNRETEQRKELTLEKGEEQTIAYLWGEKGISKTIKFKGIKTPEIEKAEHQAILHENNVYG